MRRTVAITGATGFIGRHLVRHLGQSGWQVRILTRRLPQTPDHADLTIEVVIGALEDRHALERLVRGADAIVHAAGLIKARSQAEYFAANATGTRRLVEATIGHGRKPRFLLLSSIAARQPQVSDYAASKLAAEAELTRLNGELPWSILRPSAVYGPGDRETLTFFRTIREGFALMPPGRGARLSLIHAADLASAAAMVLEAPGTIRRTYELDDGHEGGYGWQELIDVAADHLKVRPLRFRAPSSLLAAAAHLNAFVHRKSRHPPMFTSDKLREMLVTDWVAHDRSLCSATGWRAQFDIATGFAETIAWYRSQRWL